MGHQSPPLCKLKDQSGWDTTQTQSSVSRQLASTAKSPLNSVPNMEGRPVETVDEAYEPMEEVVGIAPSLELKGSMVIIAEKWPSWLFALDSAGAQHISLYLGQPSPRLRGVLRQSKVSFTPLFTWGSAFRAVQEAAYVFTQGSEEFLDDISNELDKARVCGHIVEVIDTAIEGAQSKIKSTLEDATILSHGQVGGVTAGRWAISMDPSLTPHELTKRLPLRRVLGDILRPMEHGQPFVMPPSKLQCKLQKGKTFPNQKLPTNKPLQVVVSAGLFSPTGYVARTLSSLELMDAYDVPLNLHASLKEVFNNDDGKQETLPFVSAVPTKILHRILISIFSTPPDQAASSPVKDMKISPTSESPNLPVLMRSGSLDVDNNDDDSDDEYLGDPAVKAVKHDDAEVDVRMWNTRALEDYIRPPGEPPPSVCGGTLTADIEKAFNLLRKAMMRRYRRNLVTSFRRYVDATYGVGWNNTGWKYISQDSQWLLQKADRSAYYLALDANRANNDGPSRKRKAPGTSSTSIDLHNQWKELSRDLAAARDAIGRGVNSTWWDWSSGSTLFFWRWPPGYRIAARDGARVYIKNRQLLPKCFDIQRWPSCPVMAAQLEKKIKKVKENRGYMEEGWVESLTSFFAVPKGEDDIRVVYDATKSGLNKALWAPNFPLPTIDGVLNQSDSKTWFGDIDLGEMFLNYPLDISIRSYAGVHTIRSETLDRSKPRHFHRWNRNAMGVMSSPYNSTQGFAWSEEMIEGDLDDPKNPLAWDEVKLNLPGSEDYSPQMPWCYRWRSYDEDLPGFFCTYVDDIRTGGQSKKQCYGVSRRVAARCNYLGQQDAARKRRRPAKHPGAWCGAIVVNLGPEGLFVTCSREKWNKAKGYISDLRDQLNSGVTSVNRKDLERKRGFLVHISRTFSFITPFLKGIHHTLESYRPGRDAEGWKWDMKYWSQYLSGESGTEFFGDELQEEVASHKRKHTPDLPPQEVAVVTRLMFDVEALWRFFNREEPPLRLVRGRAIHEVLYGFGDASGSGFGSTWEVDGKLHFRLGVWKSDGEGTSSNFRELKNLVDSLKEMASKGALKGREVFMFTDNSTADHAFANGTSSSKALFNLVVEARALEADYGCIIRVIHVPGKRMIAQGSDGLSRGNFNEGVMAGSTMTSFVPLSRTASSRSAGLVPWVESWVGEKALPHLKWLQPKDWFRRAHDVAGGDTNTDNTWIPKLQAGIYVWTPPPIVASFAVEQLRRARHKRQESVHIFLCPKACPSLWLKELRKVADIVIDIPPQFDFWEANQFEKLTLAICLPFHRSYPWQWRRSKTMVALERELRKVWQANIGTPGSVLREFLRRKRLGFGL